MTSPDPADEVGLLAPVVAGTAVEAATGDAALVRALLDAEAALAGAMADTGLVPDRSAAAVAETAAALRTDPRDLALRARAAGNPVLPLVADLTAAVSDRDPAAAEAVHRGATSQDIMDTALMLVSRRAAGLLLSDLDRVAAAAARLAAAHRLTPMPARTLTQHAAPTTFGLKAAGWRTLVGTVTRRLTALRAALPAQLGGAAGTLAAFTAFAPDRAPAIGPRLLAAFAARTGLAEPPLPWHVLRTPVAGLGGALAGTAGALGKIAADVLVLSRTEIGEVSEGAPGGSSALPHKANPVRATLVASAARQVPALSTVLFGSLAAEDERPAGAWHAEWRTLRDALRLTGGAAAATASLLDGLRVHPERMRRNLDATAGLVTAERLAAELSGPLGRDAARRAVSEAAARTADTGLPLADALHRQPAVSAAVGLDRLRDLTDPAGYLGAAGELVDRVLREEP